MIFGIRNKLLGGFFLILVVFTGTSIVGLYSFQLVVNSLNQTFSHPMVVDRAHSSIQILVLSMQHNMEEISLSQFSKKLEKNIQEVRANEEQALRLFRIIREQIRGEEGITLTQNAKTAFDLWKPVREKVIELAREGKYSQSWSLNESEGEEKVRILTFKLEKIGDYAARRAKNFMDKLIYFTPRARIIGISALILSIALSIGISFYLAFSINTRLKIINEATTKMAKGDIRQFVEVKGHDELKQVADNFNIMAVELSGMYDNLEKIVRERTRELNEANEELQLTKSDLEQKVNDRTRDLEDKIRELNRSHLAMLYMIEDMNLTSRRLKETQEELIQKERLAVLGQFSGNISHELRNPLGVIDSSIYYLQMRLEDQDEKIRQHLERISQGVKTSTTIIENLLNLTRMSKPNLTPCNLALLLTECIESCKISNLTEVVEDFPDEEILVLAEKEHIRMVVNNIVNNAGASMNEKGRLMVSIRKATAEAEITFRDTGAGIDPENIGKVFQPLFSTKAKGIGLGLSITRMVIENHRGTIRVESEPGQGANFIIRLPLYSEKADGTSRQESIS
ncbi:MAG: ATP-binding protein [Bacteroidetes bacterium]|nr:ATP-binding protein [Bacteroidota bacterium]